MKIEHLLKRIATGDRDAFEKFYNDYIKLVYSVAYSVTRNTFDAEDVTADVFVTVWNKAGDYKGGSGKGWLCAIAKNRALTFIKKRDRESVGVEAESQFGWYRIEDDSDDKTVIASALEILSEEERQTVLMFNAGLKHREIAEINGEPIGTVTWRYNNSLKKMRKFLQGES